MTENAVSETAAPDGAPLLVLAHGWGFDAGFWAAMAAHLPADSHIAPDRGYFGASDFSAALPTNRPLVAVGHSLGVMNLLWRDDVQWSGFVAINGFARFASFRDEFPEGVKRPVVERMIKRFDQAPDEVLADFRARCGCTDPLPSIDGSGDFLRDGLRSLRDMDGRERAGALGVPVLMLAAEDDPIVPPALTLSAASSFGPDTMLEWSATREHGRGGHLLPVTRSRWCAGRVMEFSDGLGARR